MARFSIHGANELVAALNKRADLTLVKETVTMNGAEMQEKAQRNAPVDTGHLKRSIGLASDISDGGLSARVKANAHYAGYVEWGTRYMYAQPYMRPAFKVQSAQFKKDMQRIMK